MEVISSKWNWNAVKQGTMDRLQFFKKDGLHHVFGDKPERFIVRLKIEEIDGGVIVSEQDRGENV
jgi:hypothetical protein